MLSVELNPTIRPSSFPGQEVGIALGERSGEVRLVGGAPLIAARQQRPVDAEVSQVLVRCVVEVVDPDADLVEPHRADRDAVARRARSLHPDDVTPASADQGPGACVGELRL